MSVQEQVQQILDNATSAENGVPGLIFGMLDKDGNYLAKAASGVAGADRPNEKLTVDHIYSIYSCTKILTAIACLQLVEQGKIDLDEPAEKYLPKIGQIKMVDGSSPKTKITLRHLLTHTAGFGYTFFNPQLHKWWEDQKLDLPELGADLTFPLVNEPGTRWEYGTNIDWAGQVLEAITGQTLGDYSKKNIFDPLGLQTIRYGPAKNVSKLVSLHQIKGDGTVVPREHWAFSNKKAEFDSGGAGVTSTLDDYLKVIYILINKGKGMNGAQILSPESVDLVFTAQLAPEQAKYLEAKIPAASPDLSYDVEMVPGITKNWGLSGLLTKEAWPTGRGENSIWWAGLSNLYWMADRQRGTVNFLMGQILPFNTPKVLVPWLEAETAVYNSLPK